MQISNTDVFWTSPNAAAVGEHKVCTTL